MDTTDAPQIIEHIHHNIDFTPYETRWVPCSARLAGLGIAPRGHGVLNVYELSKGDLKVVKEKKAPNGFKCATFGASNLDNRSIATGDYKGILNIWDMERLDSPTYQVQAHDKIVNCIDGCGGLDIGNGAPELVTGSRDGTVRVWDPRVQEAVVSLEPDEKEAARDCWTVCFEYNDEERVICAGYDNGDIKMFDLKNTVRWEANVGNGVVGLEFDRKDIEMNKLLTATLEYSCDTSILFLKKIAVVKFSNEPGSEPLIAWKRANWVQETCLLIQSTVLRAASLYFHRGLRKCFTDDYELLFDSPVSRRLDNTVLGHSPPHIPAAG